jgi:ribonuclease HI
MAKKQKYYVVWEGRRIGVYNSWEDCKKQTDGFTDAKFKSFETRDAANEAFAKNCEEFIGKTTKPILSDADKIKFGYPTTDAICVDAACNGATGVVEYQGIAIPSNEILFASGEFKDGTNNIGEYLAIVHALSFCKKNNIELPIYTDSLTALAWIRNKCVKTTLQPTDENKKLFNYLANANKWLLANTYTNKILKWKTELWGENPADFGRK